MRVNNEDLYEALSSTRRRRVIRAVAGGEAIDMRPLSTHLAAERDDCATSEVSDKARKREYVSLYQNHLGKLEEWGFVTWDTDVNRIRNGPTHAIAIDAIRSAAGRNSVLDRVRTAVARTREEDALGLPAGPGSIAGDDEWSVVANERRRAIITMLANQEEVETGEVAEVVAARDNDCSVAEVTADQRKTVYITLYQVHFPTLLEGGFVDWNDRTHVATRGPAYERALNVIEAVEQTTAGRRSSARRALDRLGGILGGAVDA